MPADAALQRAAVTRERLLTSAEEIFAEHGYAGASLREITERAGVNLAAANYHFRSKQGLFRAVLEQRLRPLNERRLTRLEGLKKNPRVSSILEAFMGPEVELIAELGERGPIAGKLLGRLHVEPLDVVGELLRAEIEPLEDRFVQVFHRVLPKIPRRELLWRLRCVAAAAGYALNDPTTSGTADPSDPKSTTRRLVSFLTPAMEAPLP